MQKIRDLKAQIEESLASIPTLTLPPSLEGLRHLPVSDRNPQVSIRSVKTGRKIREDAAVSYFDPDTCELVVSFVPLEGPQHEDAPSESPFGDSQGVVDDDSFETAVDQLIGELNKAEPLRPFVALKWFRDQFLPRCGHDWALEPRMRSSLLRYVTDQRLVLTSQVHNPVLPEFPVTAIRVNRKHPRFQHEQPSPVSQFRPVAIRGGPISDTVISDRR